MRLQRQLLSQVGQASAEYLVMLAMVAILAVGVKRALQPAFDSFNEKIAQRIDTMLQDGNLHRLNLR